MTLNNFLKSNPDLQYGYFPNHPDKLRRQQIIIRFDWNDRTDRDKQLSALLRSIRLPFTIHARRNAFFYLILPHIYE